MPPQLATGLSGTKNFSTKNQMDKENKSEKISRAQVFAFWVSFAAIELFLLENAAALLRAMLAAQDFSAEFFRSPERISQGIDTLLFLAFLTPLKPFEFFQFKAFACAGFFGYLAYCDGGGVFAPVAVWLCAGLLTRRLPVWLAAVVAAVAVCANAALNFGASALW